MFFLVRQVKLFYKKSNLDLWAIDRMKWCRISEVMEIPLWVMHASPSSQAFGEQSCKSCLDTARYGRLLTSQRHSMIFCTMTVDRIILHLLKIAWSLVLIIEQGWKHSLEEPDSKYFRLCWPGLHSHHQLHCGSAKTMLQQIVPATF